MRGASRTFHQYAFMTWCCHTRSIYFFQSHNTARSNCWYAVCWLWKWMGDGRAWNAIMISQVRTIWRTQNKYQNWFFKLLRLEWNVSISDIRTSCWMHLIFFDQNIVSIKLFSYSSSRWQWSRQMCSRTPRLLDIFVVEGVSSLVFIDVRMVCAQGQNFRSSRCEISCIARCRHWRLHLSCRDQNHGKIFLKKLVGNCLKPTLN
jgi:hypothetical protein